MSKVLDQLGERYGNSLATEDIDVNDRPDLAKEFQVDYLPTLLFVDAEDNVVEKKVGYMPLEEIMSTFENAGIRIE